MNSRLIFLDTETTGVDASEGHRIIEIACVEMIGRELTDNNLQVYINPQRIVEQLVIDVHGIDNAFLEDKPTFDAIVEHLLEYVRDAEVIAHNASFDLEFINTEIARVNDLKATSYPLFDHVCGKVTDSLELARERFPGMRNSLDALCNRLQIDSSKRTFHGALLDAVLLSQVWLNLTGGQQTLALESSSFTDTARAYRNESKPLRIIHATEAETERHNQYMQSLAEQ